MNGETTPKVRTTIIKVPDATPGLLFVNGQQKSFTLEGVWKSAVVPVANMTVDVALDSAGAITSITVVDAQQLNKERLEQLSGVAQERGKEAAKLAQQGVGALAARMGAVALGSSVLVWIAWFFLPSASVSGGFVGSMSFTFWNLLGVDFDNPETLMGGGSSHGAFALLGLLAIVAPFVAPFIPMAWSKYLNAAPIAYVLIAFITLYMQINKTFGDLEKMGAPNPFSWSWGFFVLVLAALVLGAHVLKPQAKA
jgi:hypothetical protein